MKPQTIETLFSVEVVRLALTEAQLRHDEPTVIAVHKFVHYLVQMGRADALWELTNEWADQGKQNAAAAVYQKHVEARDEAAERRGELKGLLRQAFGRETDEALTEGKGWN